MVRHDYDAVCGAGASLGSALVPHRDAAGVNTCTITRLPAKSRAAPRLYVEDNIDPERMAALLDVIDLKKT